MSSLLSNFMGKKATQQIITGFTAKVLFFGSVVVLLLTMYAVPAAAADDEQDASQADSTTAARQRCPSCRPCQACTPKKHRKTTRRKYSTKRTYGLELLADAPERYVVTAGDTVAGVAAKFLRQPKRWNEAWVGKSPLQLYPGDVITIDRSGKNPRLVLQRQGLPSVVPYVQQRPIILRPSVVEVTDLPERRGDSGIPSALLDAQANLSIIEEPMDRWRPPKILGAESDRMVLGTGDTVFVQGIGANAPREWMIFHPRNQIIDPDTQRSLGREIVQVGRMELNDVDGKVATGKILSANSEIVSGDLLFPTEPRDFDNIVPQAPENEISGRVALINSGGVLVSGKGSVIVINRGVDHGLQRGSVLALYRSRGQIASLNNQQKVRLPDERYGLILVFRTYSRVSYAYVTESSLPINLGDRVANP